MARLNSAHHAPVVISTLAVLIFALKRDPKTRPLVPPVEGAHNRLVLADADLKAAEAEEAALVQEVDYCDEEVDGAWMTLSRQIYARVDGDRQHPLWKKAYPEAPSTTVEGTGDAHQTQHVDRVIELVRTDDEYRDFRPYAETLATHQADLKDAQIRRTAAEAKVAAAAHHRRLALDEARRAHNRVKPDLDKIFEDQPRKVKSIWG